MEQIVKNIRAIDGVESLWVDRFSPESRTVVLCARSESRDCDVKVLAVYASCTKPTNWNIEIEIERM